MSTTRLLLLGAVRIFQPVHGYFVRRELLTWHAEEWAHLNPGSIYNGLRGLTRDGLLEEVGIESEGGRPARTTYRLTQDGETEFLTLLRRGLWNVDPHRGDVLMASWSFSWALTRAEAVAALEHRIEQIEARARLVEYSTQAAERQPEWGDRIRSLGQLPQARLDGERRWTVDVLERVRSGEFRFVADCESSE